MLVKYYSPADNLPPGARGQTSVALHNAEFSALEELREMWEVQTGQRLSIADAIRCCLWVTYRAAFPKADHLMGSPPVQTATGRKVKIREGKFNA